MHMDEKGDHTAVKLVGNVTFQISQNTGDTGVLNNFYRAMHVDYSCRSAKRGTAVVSRPSVCLSVRLSVCKFS